MEDPIIRVIIVAAALLSPVGFALLFLEKRAHTRTRDASDNLQYRWVDRYRSLSDITLDMVETCAKSHDQVQRSYQLMQRVEEENREVMAFVRRVMKK